MSKQCTKCNFTNEDSALFCVSCGTNLENVQNTSQNSFNAGNINPVNNNNNNGMSKISNFFSANKKLVGIIAAALVIIIAGGLFINNVFSSPKKTMNKFCKEFSSFDVKEALEYTDFKDEYSELYSSYSYSSKDSSYYISQIEKDLKKHYKSLKLEVMDMKEINKTDAMAEYDVTLKASYVDSDGDSDSDVKTETITFYKKDGKWLIECKSIDDLF